MTSTRTLLVSKVVCLLILLVLLTGFATAATRSPNVTIALNPSVPSPELLGTNITWTATISGGQQGHTYDYQFSAALQGQNQVVRDFNTPNSFVWVPWTVEGTYVVTVVARDITQQPYTVYPPVSVQYILRPIVTTAGQSAVNITNHPLVALFNAGPCTVGHSIRVRFRPNGSQTTMTTNAVPCSSSSANFLVAGMLPASEYQMHWEEFGTSFLNSGPDLTFTTGHLPSNFPPEPFSVIVPATQHDAAFPLVNFQLIPNIGRPFSFWPTVTDLSGNIAWYFPSQTLITRFEAGGNFFTMAQMVTSEYDLAGNQTLQTNVEILNEQLAAKGYPIMSSFNDHETRRLPNGNILLLGARDESSTMYQGGTQQNPVDILGDMILILDHNMQLIWAWDTFAHQDLSREATLGEICVHDTAGCPAFSQQFSQANDWLHSNAVSLTADGNILLSERDQDWLLKIAYNNGQGDGHVMWKMGPYGDFTITNPPHQTCGDPNVFPWFTHQHDAAFQVPNGFAEILTVFDDGNLRHTQCNGGDSRGMVLSVVEQTHTVYIQLAADLGGYSPALGSAQLLAAPPNALYASFGNGLVGNREAQSTEVDLNGNIVYELEASDGSYRSYRLRDMYTPALP
jgi:arylsulfate sulfotransferase